MNSPAPSPSPSPARGSVIAGLAVMIGWALMHVVLFYLFMVGGIVADVILIPVKAILFPGAANKGTPNLFAWAGMLQAGLTIAGAAGVPAGLAMIWRDRRTSLMRGFWVLLLVGVVCEILALGSFLTSATSVP